MKPYNFSYLEMNNQRGVYFCFRSDTWRPGDESTYVATGTREEMLELANSLNAELVASEYQGRKFTRYITNWYVTIDEKDATRLCEIDHTDKPKIAHNVELIHNKGFALWSDGKITKSVSHAPEIYGIAKCASRLINGLRGSDTGGAHLEGGMLRLAEIVEIGEDTIIARGGGRGVYNSPKVKQFDVRYGDGATQTLYSTEEGYFEGYAYDIYENLFEAMGHEVTGEEGVTDFTGYKYDPELGYVKDDGEEE